MKNNLLTAIFSAFPCHPCKMEKLYRHGRNKQDGSEDSLVQMELVSIIPVYDVPREISCTSSPCLVHATQAITVSAGLSRQGPTPDGRREPQAHE